MATSEILKLVYIQACSFSQKQNSSNICIVKKSHYRTRKALYFSSQNGTPHSIQSSYCQTGRGFSPAITNQDRYWVLYLPEQRICCKPKLLLNRNFKETRKHFDQSEINTCSGICGLIKQNSFLTVFIHLIFCVTLTLQLKVLVNKS